MVEDYRIIIRTCRAEPTGGYKVSRNGKSKPVLESVVRYETRAGTFRPEKWKANALEAIKEAGELELLELVKEYCRAHCAWLRKENALEEHAINCVCGRAYRYWTDFEYKEKC